MMLAAFSLASCGSDEPRYADPEAHEKTVKLNEQYGPLMVGTWPIPISPPSTTPTKGRFDSKDFTSKTRMDGLPSCVARQNRDSEKKRLRAIKVF